MKDTQNVTIALLCVSAAILVTVAAFTYNADQARAGGVASAAGEYIMFTGALSNATDLLYVIDLTKQRMIAYRFDPMKNTIQIQGRVDLGQTFRPPLR